MVEVPPDDELGDAMLALNEGERAFVIAMVNTGGQDASYSAHMAGFGTTPGSTKVQAWRMMRRPTIMAAIREEADRRLKSGALLGALVMTEIAMDPHHKDRFKAADRLLAGAGLGVEQTHRVIHEDHRSDAEIRRAVISLAQKYGMDPNKLLGGPDDKKMPEPMDGEFEEVSNGSEGLEDLL